MRSSLRWIVSATAIVAVLTFCVEGIASGCLMETHDCCDETLSITAPVPTCSLMTDGVANLTPSPITLVHALIPARADVSAIALLASSQRPRPSRTPRAPPLLLRFWFCSFLI